MLYNVGYIIVVSFSPILLAESGLAAASAAMVASAATWPLVAAVPIGGLIADRTGRGDAVILACLAAMAVTIPLLLLAPSPLAMLAIVGLLTGPPAGIIMGLVPQVLRPAARNLGMGIYFTWYYLGMAVLPVIAGWCRDASAVESAPLLFASVLLVLALACLRLFRQLAQRLEPWAEQADV